jgi:DNA invertase Pin-like site-specific DNA recombinase
MCDDRTIAIYTRVSSRQQDTASQEPDLARWETAFADGRPVERYTDTASGKTMNRREWNQLEADIDAGKVSTLVVWRLDRLGRTAAGLVVLFEKLTARKVNLVSIKDGVDLSTPAGRLLANVLASVAMFETEVRGERVAAGQAAARAAGKKWGGSKKGRRISLSDDSIRLVRQMAAQGERKAAIVRATRLSRSTIYRILGEGQPS